MAQRTRERKTVDDGLQKSAGPYILVIDDDDDSRTVLLYQLSLEGYLGSGAATGISGVRAARTIKPDVVLLDLNLPDIHGLEVIELMRADPALAGIPIVVISGERPVIAARALSIGATAFHPKPLDFGGLLETLRGLESALPRTSA